MATLPNDQTLEGVVLGIAMTSADAAINIVADVDGVDFFNQTHQVVFTAVRALAERGAVADSAAVVSELKATGQIECIGGILGNAISYVRGLALAAPDAANMSEYISQLKSLSLRRGIITQASEALRSVTDMSNCVEELVDRIAIGFTDLAVHKHAQAPLSIRELALHELKDLEERREKYGRIGISTGYLDIDAIIGGLEKQTLTLIAGRPSMGKSALGGSIAVNVAKGGLPVLIFSLEMSGAALFRRMVASEGRVSATNLRRGQLGDGELSKVTSALGRLGDLSIHVDQDSGVSEIEIRARARRHKAHYGLGLVLVDHVQLVRSDRHEKTRDLEVGNVSWGLKRLAKEIDVPVIALCQLNRAVESRAAGARKPTLADLRDSGNLEQNADIVIGLYREGYYDKNSKRATELDVGVLKNREGETGETVLRWNAKSVRFDNFHCGEDRP